MSARRPGDLPLFLRIAEQTRPYWPHVSGVLALRLLSIPLALLSPLPVKLVVDSVVGSHPLPPFLAALAPASLAAAPEGVLALAAGLLVALALLAYLRGMASWLLETWTGERLTLDLRARLFHAVQRLSLAYHDRRGTTDSLYRIQYDAPSLQHIAVHGVIPLVAAGFTLGGMLYVTARIDPTLALVALGVVPLLYVATQHFRARIRNEWTQVKGIESTAMGVIQEALGALRVVKAFGREDREASRFLERSEGSVRGQLRLAWLNGGFDLLIGLTLAAGTATVLTIGVRHVQSGALTLGSLLIVMAYLAQLYDPLQTLSRKFAELQASLASAERAFAVLDEGQEVVERADARALPRASGALAFRDVSFAYPSGPPVLRNVRFELEAGTRLAVVGTTGAGKTTLAALLLRFYDPSEGAILLDGIDLRDYRLADLRRQFAVVLQDPVLFSASVLENISYGRPDASEAEILEAARRAGAHGFVSRLPEGYHTQVGERGLLLSGGERQRIALARAFLRDAPILILDEPTSAVDLDTEQEIVAAAQELMRGRTTLLIAHRPSTLHGCEAMLRVEGGRVVGPHLLTHAQSALRAVPSSA